MKNFSNLLAWGSNGPDRCLGRIELEQPDGERPLNLLEARIDVAMGVIMLALSGVMVAALVFAYLHNHIGFTAQGPEAAQGNVSAQATWPDEGRSLTDWLLQRLMSKGFQQLDQMSRFKPAPGASHP